MSESIRRFRFEGNDTITLPARREAFELLEEWLAGIAAELRLPSRTARQLMVAADEVFTNISSYGYPSGQGMATAEVAFDLEAGELTLVFRDEGVAFNPLSSAPEPPSGPLAERSPGGLGIFLVRKLMDTATYRREDGRNVLTLTKRVAAGTERVDG